MTKIFQTLYGWISYRTLKLTEFLFKQSVSWKVFVSRSPAGKKISIFNSSLQVYYSLISRRKVIISKKKVRMGEE